MELPGEKVHLEMAPIERLLELKKKAREMKSAKKAAVLCLFYPTVQQNANLVLILRKTYKGVHSAQVGFPGGKVEEEDDDLTATALRETEEEIGVHPTAIEVLKELTEIYIPPSNFFVQPFLGMTADPVTFIPQDDEVEAIIEVPVAEFLNDEVRFTQTLQTSYAREIAVPAFKLQGHTVWGATAMMLNEVRVLLKAAID